jgi:branched-chain amino acid transport system substrate-binding protein
MSRRRLTWLVPAVAVTLALVAGARSAVAVTGARQPAIRIGLLADCKGNWSFTYDIAIGGAELALIERGATPSGRTPVAGVHGATVGGRPVSLVYGCMDGTATSALVEARRLVEREHADIVIGPIAANEERALQGYARLRPDTVFVDGSASAHLQHQAPNFYSFHGDGAQWMAGLGTYAYRTLGWRNVVTITQEPDVFGWDETAGFLAEFCSLGGNVRSRISVAPATTDFSAIVAKVPRRRVDGLLIATSGLSPAAVIAVALARSYPGLQGNISRRIILGVGDQSPLRRLGPRIRGLVFGDRVGLGAVPGTAYYTRFHRTFPGVDASFIGYVFDLDYYTAMKATLQALAQVEGDLSDGERAFKSALAHLRLVTPSGPVRLDERHRAIVSNFLQQIPGSDPNELRQIRTVPNVDATFGGYFGPHDPAPTQQGPPCKHGHPPPWTR